MKHNTNGINSLISRHKIFLSVRIVSAQALVIANIPYVYDGKKAINPGHFWTKVYMQADKFHNNWNLCLLICYFLMGMAFL